MLETDPEKIRESPKNSKVRSTRKAPRKDEKVKDFSRGELCVNAVVEEFCKDEMATDHEDSAPCDSAALSNDEERRRMKFTRSYCFRRSQAFQSRNYARRFRQIMQGCCVSNGGRKADEVLLETVVTNGEETAQLSSARREI